MTEKLTPIPVGDGEISFGKISFDTEPHELDAKLVDETPVEVIDEEGFIVARFRFWRDANGWVDAVNSVYPCAEYSIKTEGEGG